MMGWHGHELPTKDWYLYTRGGIRGVFIQQRDSTGNAISEKIEIPGEILKMLVSEEIRGKIIREMEQKTADKILGL